jgi:hypothetical protein
MVARDPVMSTPEVAAQRLAGIALALPGSQLVLAEWIALPRPDQLILRPVSHLPATPGGTERNCAQR